MQYMTIFIPRFKVQIVDYKIIELSCLSLLVFLCFPSGTGETGHYIDFATAAAVSSSSLVYSLNSASYHLN